MDAILIQTDVRTGAKQAAAFALKIRIIITRDQKIAVLLYVPTAVLTILQDARPDAPRQPLPLYAETELVKAWKHPRHALLIAPLPQQLLRLQEAAL